MLSDAEMEKLYVTALDQYEGGGKTRPFRTLLDLAKRGYLPAMCAVGILYSVGIGTPENKMIAISWWRKAARTGDPVPMLNIGTEYRDHLGNFRQARHWLVKAATAGDASAYLELARLWYGRDRTRHCAKVKCYLDKALAEGSILSEAEREDAEAFRERLKNAGT
ncbi:MAG TPA: hypothetical protein VGF97_13775 [Rhizomicrobium sp.]|jgi:TPR repeat protein